MPRAIALKLQPQSALAVVVRTSGRGIVAEAVVPVSLADGDGPAAIGQKIAAALAAAGVNRAPTVVALPRTELHWANYDLPPAPVDELPQLVQLQAQRDIVLADDGVGFDYVSLHGDVEHPHHVLGVGVSPNQLERIRAICAAADLKLQRLVPVPLGWVELSRRIAAVAESAGAEGSSPTVFAAMAGRQSAVWALEDDTLRLVRTVWLAAEPSEEDDLAALAGELRRTLMSLAHTAGKPADRLPCVYVGEQAERVAKQLGAALNRSVRGVRLEDLVETPAHDALGGVSYAELAPLAALGASAATESAAPLDLLHPHRPPAPPSQRRTYALAGVAAACVALALVWGGYRRIAGPRELAAADDAERAALEPSLERMAELEAQAAAVDAWLNQSGNMLSELDYLGQQLRPKPLSDAAFNSGEDLILTKLSVAGRQVTIEGAARTTDAVASIERRLRDGSYSAIRGIVENATDATPGYAARMTEVLERAGSEAGAQGAPPAASAAAAAPATSTPAPSAAAATATTPSPTPSSGTPPATESATPSADKPQSTPAEETNAAPPAESEPAVQPATTSQPVIQPAVTAAPAGSPYAAPPAAGAYSTDAYPAAAPVVAPTAAPAAAPEGSP